MSLNTNGLSCVRCKSYLFPEDDIVYCPVCGAPHHRDCYSVLGHCALESLHGTPEEYSRDKEIAAMDTANESKEEPKQENNTTRCEMCGDVYDSQLKQCPKCGTPGFASMNNIIQFDFLGGVPADYDLGDGISANEAKNFVMANTQRYIPKFATLNKKHRVSWNWAAFLFPCGWLLSRKMYKNGIIAGLLTVIATMLYYPLNLKLYNMGFSDAPFTYETIETLSERLPEVGNVIMALAGVSLIINLFIRLLSAVFGDYSYKKYTLANIKHIKSKSEDITADYRKKGGVNIFLFLIGVMLVEYIPLIIISIL